MKSVNVLDSQTNPSEYGRRNGCSKVHGNASQSMTEEVSPIKNRLTDNVSDRMLVKRSNIAFKGEVHSEKIGELFTQILEYKDFTPDSAIVICNKAEEAISQIEELCKIHKAWQPKAYFIESEKVDGSLIFFKLPDANRVRLINQTNQDILCQNRIIKTNQYTNLSTSSKDIDVKINNNFLSFNIPESIEIGCRDNLDNSVKTQDFEKPSSFESLLAFVGSDDKISNTSAQPFKKSKPIKNHLSETSDNIKAMQSEASDVGQVFRYRRSW